MLVRFTTTKKKSMSDRIKPVTYAIAYTVVGGPGSDRTLDLEPPGDWSPECDLPVILDWCTTDGITVWCRLCRCEHNHGRRASIDGCQFNGLGPDPCTCPVGSGNGHRQAHCDNPDSLYNETGYYIAGLQTS